MSRENLQRDVFLRRNMDKDGWLLLSMIGGFPRINLLTQDLSLINEALQQSDKVELCGDESAVETIKVCHFTGFLITAVNNARIYPPKMRAS